MTFDECNDKYLVIGRNRRAAEGRGVSASGRQLMAHKGLGKLACFGIANTIEIKTVHKSRLTHFVMKFEEIDKLNQGETYYPKILADNVRTKLRSGTTVILRDISKEITVNKDQFLRSMAARFTVLSDKFRVYVNGRLLKRELGVKIQFRFPEKAEDDVEAIQDGLGITRLSPGIIKWWIGFSPEPIKTRELQGISVLTNGKMSQEPWAFDLAGGTTGQHGLQYIIGEITADFLDSGLEKDSDHVGTNRCEVLWNDPEARPLYDWAQKKIKHLLRVWAERRAKARIKEVRQQHPELITKIENFPAAERKELNQALRKLAEVPTITTQKLVEVFDYVVDGYTDKTLTELLENLKDMGGEDQVAILDLLRTFDVLEAIRVHKIVVAHVNVIRTFERMIRQGVPEKPDMQEHLRKYPWLLGPKYETMEHEITLDRLLKKHFGLAGEGKAGKRRADFVCFRGGRDVLVIELKRPGELAGRQELSQIATYVDYLRTWASTTTTQGVLGQNINPQDIRGYLIAYDYGTDSTLTPEIKRLEKDGIFILKWDDVLRRTREEHAEYLKIVKAKAPKDDPRIKELEEKGLADN
jgi:hypothetical protein